MDNNRCKAFLECVEKGSISAAADSLGYTPSAVSQLITSLERDLGLKLLSRSQKGVTLTPEGKAIVPVIRSYLMQEKEIYRTASELKGVVKGRITIAAYPSIATSWLPEIVRQFKTEYPGIHFSFKESIREDIFKQFEQNEADLGFLAYSEPMPYEWIPLCENRVIAVVPEDHPMASHATYPITEIENENFILGSQGKEEEILEILRKNNLHPEIKYTTYDTPASIALVRMGLGVALVNELSAKNWNEDVVKMPLDPPASLELGVAFPSYDKMTNAARKFLDCTLKYFGKA